MKMKEYLKILLLLPVVSGIFVSCQKEAGGGGGGGTNPPANQKPKVGTTWTYSYYVFNTNGGLHSTETVVYKAKTQETIGGETWLKVVNNANDTLVYYLKQKTDGLYHYANGAANLLCKYPAALNDTYTGFLGGGVEDFIVKGVNNTLATNIGDIKVNYYDGSRGGDIFDNIWYNDNAFIVHHTVYRKLVVSGVYYKWTSLFIQSIVY
jgi:hypothetical protein